MHSIVNHIPLKPDTDWDEMLGIFESFAGRVLPEHPEVLALKVVRPSDAEMILIISFTDAESLAQFSSNIAGPWFAENIRSFMGGPADRKTGEVVAHYKQG